MQLVLVLRIDGLGIKHQSSDGLDLHKNAGVAPDQSTVGIDVVLPIDDPDIVVTAWSKFIIPDRLQGGLGFGKRSPPDPWVAIFGPELPFVVEHRLTFVAQSRLQPKTRLYRFRFECRLGDLDLSPPFELHQQAFR